MTPDPWCTASEHGDMRAYKSGCRCVAARAANASYVRERRKDVYLGRPRMVSGVGTQRRLKGLLALGWTSAELSARLGVGNAVISRLCYRDVVYARTAASVAALYDELSMTPGPSDITRRRAARAGWVPPLAWDDDAIDNPAAKPYNVTRTRDTFTLQDVEELSEAGESWFAIQIRLGTNRNALHARLRRAGRQDIGYRIDRNTTQTHEQRNQWSA